MAVGAAPEAQESHELQEAHRAASLQPTPPEPESRSHPLVRVARVVLGLAWLAFQLYIISYPQAPLVQRPLHLVLAMALLLLWTPLVSGRAPRGVTSLIDGVLLLGVLAAGAYYLVSATRLTERMEGIDPILTLDMVFGVLVVVILLECVRRVVGWSLLSVLLLFLAYAFVGEWAPGWLRFSGFEFEQTVEILTMSLNGILGITTETSLQFVFYFVMFGAIYSAIGGGQLFIDIGLRLSGRHQGGAAKAAVIASSMMGSISGSAVANVAATGVFTIPLMRRAGYPREMAGAIEAISSTGGQLMPPIMGVAAFVVAEMLQIPYGQVALAGLIPALAFYLAVFLVVDLTARKTGIGTLPPQEIGAHPPIGPRLYLMSPPAVLVAMLVAGYSATYSAVAAGAACVLISYVRRDTWFTPGRLVEVVESGTRQACHVAVPIAAIGIIIAVAIQSNLALKFSSQLISGSGGTLLGAMALIVVGCIIMGMGLPTVAAYIIGAILFVPALLKLGIPELSAHFFVMYYCVLSMVTPPVALASYTAAGIAGAGTMPTSLHAFRLSFVSFLIPFAFAFDPRLLGQGPAGEVALGFASLLVGTAAWAVAMVGYVQRKIGIVERLLFAAAAVATIFSPTGSAAWGWSLLGLGLVAAWSLLIQLRSGVEC